MGQELAANVNALLVLGGFVALEGGIAAAWSGALAAIVGGVVVMGVGSWPYLVRTWRKRT